MARNWENRDRYDNRGYARRYDRDFDRDFDRGRYDFDRAGPWGAYGRDIHYQDLVNRPDHDRYRGRSYNDRNEWSDRNDRYRESRFNRRGHENDRGFFDRAEDEVRSWFGDDDARRRRDWDDRNAPSDYRSPYDRRYDRNREFDRDFDRRGARSYSDYSDRDYNRGMDRDDPRRFFNDDDRRYQRENRRYQEWSDYDDRDRWR